MTLSLNPSTPIRSIILFTLIVLTLLLATTLTRVDGGIHRHANYTLYPMRLDGTNRPSPNSLLEEYRLMARKDRMRTSGLGFGSRPRTTKFTPAFPPPKHGKPLSRSHLFHSESITTTAAATSRKLSTIEGRRQRPSLQQLQVARQSSLRLVQNRRTAMLNYFQQQLPPHANLKSYTSNSRLRRPVTSSTSTASTPNIFSRIYAVARRLLSVDSEPRIGSSTTDVTTSTKDEPSPTVSPDYDDVVSEVDRHWEFYQLCGYLMKRFNTTYCNETEFWESWSSKAGEFDGANGADSIEGGIDSTYDEFKNTSQLDSNSGENTDLWDVLNDNSTDVYANFDAWYNATYGIGDGNEPIVFTHPIHSGQQGEALDTSNSQGGDTKSDAESSTEELDDQDLAGPKEDDNSHSLVASSGYENDDDEDLDDVNKLPFDYIPLMNDTDDDPIEGVDELLPLTVSHTPANVSVHKLNLWNVFPEASKDAKSQHGHLIRLRNPFKHFTFLPPRGNCNSTTANGGLERTSENAKRNKCRVATNAGFFNIEKSAQAIRSCYNGLIINDGEFIQKQHTRYKSKQFTRNVHFGLTDHGHFFVGYVTEELLQRHLKPGSLLPADIDDWAEYRAALEERRLDDERKLNASNAAFAEADRLRQEHRRNHSTTIPAWRRRHHHSSSSSSSTGTNEPPTELTPAAAAAATEAVVPKVDTQPLAYVASPPDVTTTTTTTGVDPRTGATYHLMRKPKAPPLSTGPAAALNVTLPKPEPPMEYVPLSSKPSWHFTTLLGGVLWLVRDGRDYIEQSIADGEDMTVERSDCPDAECGRGQGRPTGPGQSSYLRDEHFVHLTSARTAIGHTASGELLIISVDGFTHDMFDHDYRSFTKQQERAGINLHDMASLLISFGALNAINLDGGGSATVAVDGVVSNYPSDFATLPKELLAQTDWSATDQLLSQERAVSTITCIHDDFDESDLTPPTLIKTIDFFLNSTSSNVTQLLLDTAAKLALEQQEAETAKAHALEEMKVLEDKNHQLAEKLAKAEESLRTSTNEYAALKQQNITNEKVFEKIIKEKDELNANETAMLAVEQAAKLKAEADQAAAKEAAAAEADRLATMHEAEAHKRAMHEKSEQEAKQKEEEAVRLQLYWTNLALQVLSAFTLLLGVAFLFYYYRTKSSPSQYSLFSDPDLSSRRKKPKKHKGGFEMISSVDDPNDRHGIEIGEDEDDDQQLEVKFDQDEEEEELPTTDHIFSSGPSSSPPTVTPPAATRSKLPKLNQYALKPIDSAPQPLSPSIKKDRKKSTNKKGGSLPESLPSPSSSSSYRSPTTIMANPFELGDI